jgi:hypothetical protein
MVEFSVKNATTFVITKILKFVKIITKGGDKLTNITFFLNPATQL